MYSCSWGMEENDDRLVVGSKDCIFRLAFLLWRAVGAVGVTVRNCSTGEITREWKTDET